MHTVAGARPNAIFIVEADTVEQTDGSFDHDAAIDRRAIRGDVEAPDMSRQVRSGRPRGIDDEKLLLICRESQPVRLQHGLDNPIEAFACRIKSVHMRPVLLVESTMAEIIAVDAVAGIGEPIVPSDFTTTSFGLLNRRSLAPCRQVR